MTALSNPTHLLALLVVLLLVFGAKRLPELGRSLGSGMRSFREEIAGGPGQPAVTGAHAPALMTGPAAESATADAGTAGASPDPRSDPA